MPQSKAPAALTRPITGFTFGGAHEMGLRDCAEFVAVAHAVREALADGHHG